LDLSDIIRKIRYVDDDFSITWISSVPVGWLCNRVEARTTFLWTYE